jgi:hypothetical protein
MDGDISPSTRLSQLSHKPNSSESASQSPAVASTVSTSSPHWHCAVINFRVTHFGGSPTITAGRDSTRLKLDRATDGSLNLTVLQDPRIPRRSESSKTIGRTTVGSGDTRVCQLSSRWPILVGLSTILVTQDCPTLQALLQESTVIEC